MTQQSAWQLFFATGLPVAYLLAKQVQCRDLAAPPQREQAQPAFQGRPWGEDQT